MIYTLAAMALALLLDRWWGEPRRWHPLVGFGALANALERRLNGGDARRAKGVCALLLLVVPLVMVALWLQAWLWSVSGWLFALAVALPLYAAIGRRSLAEHALAVADALAANDLPAARAAVARVVSRDTAVLDASGVSKAAVETVLENGSDAVTASLFWFALAGLPGVVLHRAVNTLDAMWGYRNARFLEFGWAAARFDDVLNFVPARLTALSYALVGRFGSAWRCWRSQARAWSSPNGGPVMAAGAGALAVQLGGGTHYEGQWEERPPLGCGRAPEPADIGRALALLNRAVVVWLLAMGLIAVWLS